MAFTRPIVHPVDIPRRPVTRATVDLVPDRDELRARLGPASWGRAFVVGGLLVFLVWGTVERSVAADRVRRAEVEAREGHLYRQLSNRDAVLESQRLIYIERIRKLEAQLRDKDREISALRTRANGLVLRPAISQ